MGDLVRFLDISFGDVLLIMSSFVRVFKKYLFFREVIELVKLF